MPIPSVQAVQSRSSAREYFAMKLRELHFKVIDRASQPALFFPTDDEPEIVSVNCSNRDRKIFKPYLDPDLQGNEGSAQIQSVPVELDSMSAELFYFEQTAQNGFTENDALTRELEALTDGLRRPWLGPVIVIYDDNKVLKNDDLALLAEQIVIYMSNCYPEFVRDDVVEFDRLEGEESGGR
ncbi:hypothetical protein VNI00_003484 [Paramarasmius palmivorus]|uniref:Uncharacterized protein n=1 Tax=Paramarasmius palmivorus TaxID=297713 RepID=A0AAW0DTW5_9AGAR